LLQNNLRELEKPNEITAQVTGIVVENVDEVLASISEILVARQVHGFWI